MPIDRFSAFADGPAAPATRCFAVVPHPTDELPQATKALYIGGAGDVTLRSIAGEQDVVFRNLAAGSILDVRVAAVRVAGTTATNIVGLA